MKFAMMVSALCLVGLATGCAAETATQDETTAEVTSAYRAVDYEKLYFSDKTFLHQVGEYNLGCGTSAPVRRGTVTNFYMITTTKCDGQVGGTRTCYDYDPIFGVQPAQCPY